MKTISIIILAIFILTILGCGDSKIINNKTYETYGLINKDNVYNPNIKYKPIWGNIILGILLVETVIAPLYFWGFSSFEPIGIKNR